MDAVVEQHFAGTEALEIQHGNMQRTLEGLLGTRHAMTCF